MSPTPRPRPARDAAALFGAFPDRSGARFRVRASHAREVTLLVETGARRGVAVEMPRAGAGWFEARVRGVRPGDRYRYLLDGRGPFPDPASRFQPDGVHGPSEVVDPAAWRWRHATWPVRPLEETVFYELHVGTFTRAGTFAAAARRLGDLARLGVTTLELMPLHAFPGTRNWGYDPGALWAPAHAYGRPEDLAAFVDEAHGHGLAVVLDVVFNHLSPDGAYVAAFDRNYLTTRHRSGWGAGINLDGPGSGAVRAFILGCALHWLGAYRMDGLRLDATRFLRDAGECHLMQDLVRAVRRAFPDRRVLLVAEDGRNSNRTVAPLARGGLGCDAEWSFDLHHQWHAALTGERHHYYADFAPRLAGVARALERGWLLDGRPSRFYGRRWGTPPRAVPPRRLVSYLQSHDETGNRPRGERLHRLAGPGAARAALAVLFAAPHTPMLFMGEEWAASTPFLFFTDHREPLGRRIAAARARMFARWPGGRTAAARARIPDPQARATFEACRLRWSEARRAPHAAMRRWVRALIALRASEPALRAVVGSEAERAAARRTGAGRVADFGARAAGDRVLALWRTAPGAAPIAVIAAPRGPARAELAKLGLPPVARWEVLMTSEDRAFVGEGRPARVALDARRARVSFARAGAVVLRGRPAFRLAPPAADCGA